MQARGFRMEMVDKPLVGRFADHHLCTLQGHQRSRPCAVNWIAQQIQQPKFRIAAVDFRNGFRWQYGICWRDLTSEAVYIRFKQVFIPLIATRIVKIPEVNFLCIREEKLWMEAQLIPQPGGAGFLRTNSEEIRFCHITLTE